MAAVTMLSLRPGGTMWRVWEGGWQDSSRGQAGAKLTGAGVGRVHVSTHDTLPHGEPQGLVMR